MTYDAGDVVVVPFPFTDKNASKRRPALVLSSTDNFNSGHSVLAMITSAKNTAWPLDTIIQDISTTGLPDASLVRMKLFTLDNRLIVRKAGTLAPKDKQSVATAIQTLFTGILTT